MRNRLKTESNNFDYEISKSLTIPIRGSFGDACEKANQQNECQFDDIESALEKVFDGCYVSNSDEEHFIDQFTLCSMKPIPSSENWRPSKFLPHID